MCGLDTCPVWSECEELDSVHRASNRCPSSKRDEGRTTTALLAFGCAFPQHCAKIRLGYSKAFWFQATWVSGYRCAGCCADVMRCVVMIQRYISARLVSPGNSSWLLPSATPPATTFTLGTEGNAKRTGVDSFVNPSSRLLYSSRL